MNLPMVVPAEGCVLVCDGRKALFLRNEGDAVFPDLQVCRLLRAKDNPPTHEQGSDRPGRVVMGSHRSAVDQADLHAAAEDLFAQDVMGNLEALHASTPKAAIILVAPPRMLAALRKVLPRPLEALVKAEIAKELVNLPIFEIEQHLVGAPG